MLVLAGPNLQWIHPSISILSRILDARDYMLARTYDNVMNCNQKRTRPSAKLQTLTDPHILQKAVANTSLFTPTGAEVHLCLLCFPEASGKAPHPRLG